MLLIFVSKIILILGQLGKSGVQIEEEGDTEKLNCTVEKAILIALGAIVRGRTSAGCKP